MPVFKAWSFSALQQFNNCPRQYYETKVAKSVKEKPGAAMDYGMEVHKKLENAVKFGSKIPPGMEYAGQIVEALRKKPGELFAERELCINAQMKPVEFFAKDAWCRGKIDVGIENIEKRKMWQGDWKTGKRKPDSDQMMLFTALTFETHPHIDEITTSFIWIPDRKWDTETYTRDQLPLIWKHFMPKVNRMKAAFDKDEWVPRPSGLCRGYCPVTNCEHWEAKK